MTTLPTGGEPPYTVPPVQIPASIARSRIVPIGSGKYLLTEPLIAQVTVGQVRPDAKALNARLPAASEKPKQPGGNGTPTEACRARNVTAKAHRKTPNGSKKGKPNA